MIQSALENPTQGAGLLPTTCDIYLRLSDMRNEEALDGREGKLRAEAAHLGWVVHRVVIENDIRRGKDGQMRPASAFKRKLMRTPSGNMEMRVDRPGYRSILDDIIERRADALLTEDLDRTVRDPRDLEDLLDACAKYRASARSLSGSLTLTEGGNDSEIFMARIMVAQANKSSRDTSRRVSAKREQLHGQSYAGGPRPYGYVPATDSVKYHRTLMVVPDEAELLRRAADDLLNKHISLKARAREMREQGIPTARGGRWTSTGLRDVLLKPTIAGLALNNGTLVEAPWDPILDRDVWERLAGVLKDPSRVMNSGNGNEPRWLLSLIGKCGKCTEDEPGTICGRYVKKTGRPGAQMTVTGRYPAYVCREKMHLRRSAPAVDEFIGGLIVSRLSKDDAHDLLKPPPRARVDVSDLRAESRKLQDRKATQIRMHAEGLLEDADLAAGLRNIRDRLAVIEAQLATSDEVDPLEEFRDRPAGVVWESLSLPRKRAVVKLLVDVTFLPTTHRGPGFDPDSLSIDRKI